MNVKVILKFGAHTLQVSEIEPTEQMVSQLETVREAQFQLRSAQSRLYSQLSEAFHQGQKPNGRSSANASIYKSHRDAPID